MFDDDTSPLVPIQHVIGMELDALSVHELEERLALLRDEIARLEAELATKGSTLAAAESLFSRG